MIAGLQWGDAAFQVASARELGRLGDRAATPALVAALKHPLVDIRAPAAEALGALGDPQAAEPLAAAALGGCLDNEDGEVRRLAREALESIVGADGERMLTEYRTRRELMWGID